MDQNLRYVKQQKIALLLNEMVIHLLSAKPAEPMDSLIAYLELKQKHEVPAGKAPAAAAAAAATAPKDEAEAVEPKEEDTPTPAPEAAAAEQPAAEAAAPTQDRVPDEATAAAEASGAAAAAALPAFPFGCSVDVLGDGEAAGQRGRVVGWEEGSGAPVLAFADARPDAVVAAADARRVVDDAEQAFAKGARVVLAAPAERAGEAGRVESHWRGRVGVELDGGGGRVGVSPQMLRREDAPVQQSFPLGTVVELLAGATGSVGSLGVVLGYSRGRVGLAKEEGGVEGLPAGAVRKVGKTAAQAFPVGTFVECVDTARPELSGVLGRVTGQTRGRVGVTLDTGAVCGFVPAHLRAAGAPHRVGQEVEVTAAGSAHEGERGYVRSVHRGRLGVELIDSGATVGLLPQHVRAAGGGAAAAVPPRVGSEVELLRAAGELCGGTGRVAAAARGRVGVELATGQTVGVPFSAVRVVAAAAPAVGAAVDVCGGEWAGRAGKVIGCARGRAGVEFSEDGARAGVPLSQLRVAAKAVERAFPLSSEVVVVGDTAHSGLAGRVAGHSRGRVGVVLESGESVGFPAQQLVRRTAAVLGESVPVGAFVEVVDACSAFNGQTGQVSGRARGRVGLCLESGEQVGLPASALRRVQLSGLQAFPVGSRVCVSAGGCTAHDGCEGQVVGHNRGRVGLELDDGTRVGLPTAQVRAVGKTGPQGFPVGTAVLIVGHDTLSGEDGQVVGHSRGRVGVHLTDGRNVGVPASQLRKQQPEASNQFPVGCYVCIVNESPTQNGQDGQVIGHSRGRVGIDLMDGTRVGCPASQLRKVEKTGPQAFPVGSSVMVANDIPAQNCQDGIVVGHSRGRVGVDLPDGRRIGIPATSLRKVDPRSEASQFPVGCYVCIVNENPAQNGQDGQVIGHSRGRVGIDLMDGTRVGCPASQLRKVEKTGPQAFSVGSRVTVVNDVPAQNGQEGQVIGHSRGRVGIDLSDGTRIGIPATSLRKVDPRSEASQFPVGCYVCIVNENPAQNGQDGQVIGHSRGRVGIDLMDGTRVGCPASQLRKVEKTGPQAFSVGSRVTVVNDVPAQNGQEGQVIGHSRGRVGIDLSDGTRIGIPATSLRKVDPRSEASQFPVGCYVCIVNENPAQNGQDGQVIGHSRGRVGIDLMDGTRVGCPASQLRKVEKTGPQAFSVGSRVMVVNDIPAQNGQEGQVIGHSRGRVGVHLMDGTKIGCPAAQLTLLRAEPARDFPVGMHVVVVCELPGHNAEEGTVTHHSRGRVGVRLTNGETIGVPAGQLRLVAKSAAQSFDVGAFVEIRNSNPAQNAQTGRVTGVSRGRVGVRLQDDSVVGVPAAQLHALGKASEQAFPLGATVENLDTGDVGTVVGCRGDRVGVELSDGSAAGVVRERLRNVTRSATHEFPVGSMVDVVGHGEHDGLRGSVAGHHRGRVTVCVDGSDDTIAVPPAFLRVAACAAFADGDAVEIVRSGATGTVSGSSRGRVGVVLEEGAEPQGFPAAQVRALAGGQPPLEAGTVVHVVRQGHARDGQQGVVAEKPFRGRVPIDFDGEAAGVPPTMLRVQKKAEYSEGEAVTVLGDGGSKAGSVCAHTHTHHTDTPSFPLPHKAVLCFV